MRLGIRLQILLSLGVLLAISFLPLYVAVARLTEASLASARRESARDLGRAIASHILTAKSSRSPGSLDSLLEAQLSEGGVAAIAVYDAGGARAATAGDAAFLPDTVDIAAELVQTRERPSGRVLFIVVPNERRDGAVAMALTLDPQTEVRPQLVNLVALYTGVVALALLVFAYFAMTRLVVRPIDDLSHAAGRIAAGGRSLDLRTTSAREIAELGDSLRAMTESLLREEQALRAKIEELESAKKALESAQETVIRSERLASVGRLAAGVAHEIGNPIAAILGFEELLLDGDLQPEEQRDFLQRMKRETERVSHVLRDLLDFARPRTADAGATAGRADVREAALIVTALVQPQKQMQNIELDVSVDADVPEVGLSSERLQQVLLNLVLNAADVAHSRIELRGRLDGDAVLITVEDDGPGVVPSVRKRLFEPFVTSKEIGKGTGLGLAVCRGLVEAVGGTIELREDGVEGDKLRLGGALFALRLPLAPSA